MLHTKPTCVHLYHSNVGQVYTKFIEIALDMLVVKQYNRLVLAISSIIKDVILELDKPITS